MLFYKNYTVYRIVYIFHNLRLLSLHQVSLLYFCFLRYCLRVFIVVLQELHCLLQRLLLLLWCVI